MPATRATKRQIRDTLILVLRGEMVIDQPCSVETVAEYFEVDPRTVQRVCQRARAAFRPAEDPS